MGELEQRFYALIRPLICLPTVRRSSEEPPRKKQARYSCDELLALSIPGLERSDIVEGEVRGVPLLTRFLSDRAIFSDDNSVFCYWKRRADVFAELVPAARKFIGIPLSCSERQQSC